MEASSCLSSSSARSCCTYLSEPGLVPDILCGSTISERVVTVGVMVSILRKGIDSLQSRNVRQVPFMVPKDHTATRNFITKLAANECHDTMDNTLSYVTGLGFISRSTYWLSPHTYKCVDRPQPSPTPIPIPYSLSSYYSSSPLMICNINLCPCCQHEGSYVDSKFQQSYTTKTLQ